MLFSLRFWVYAQSHKSGVRGEQIEEETRAYGWRNRTTRVWVCAPGCSAHLLPPSVTLIVLISVIALNRMIAVTTCIMQELQEKVRVENLRDSWSSRSMSQLQPLPTEQRCWADFLQIDSELNKETRVLLMKMPLVRTELRWYTSDLCSFNKLTEYYWNQSLCVVVTGELMMKVWRPQN